MTSPWLNPPPDGRRFAAAFGVGLLLECAAALVLLPALSHRPPPADVQSVIKLSIVAPPPKPAPPPPTPKPVPPPPKPVPPPPPVAPPIPMPPPPPIPRPAQHVIRHYVKPRIVPPKVLPPVVQTPPTPPPPPAPPVQPVSLGEIDLFREAMRRAVQAVADQVYPDAAKMAQESGEPEVSFVYQNGVVSDVTLVRSCGYPLLDDAAMKAVRIAQFPPEPPDFHGQAESVTVSVIFQVLAPEVDGD